MPTVTEATTLGVLESSVAVQGEQGSFSHQAARQLFGAEVRIEPCADFDALMDAVATRQVESGVVPVENTLVGSVPRNLDRILEAGLVVVRETEVRVELCLIAARHITLDQVHVVASHPVALEQCRSFFSDHRGLQPRSVDDTAGSVRDLMAGSVDYQAAIASELAAELYGAGVLAHGIEDHAANFTRFYEVRHPASRGDGANDREALVAAQLRSVDEACRVKAVIAFVVEQAPDALHEALQAIATAGADLSRLESRPIAGRPWVYRFYADVRGARHQVQAAIDGLGRAASEDVVLGVFAENPVHAPHRPLKPQHP